MRFAGTKGDFWKIPKMTPSVSMERWKRAQAWELAFWQQDQKKQGWKRVAFPIVRPFLAAWGDRRATGDDSNLWWADQFDQYSFLPTHLGDIIELGCGPYTNVRVILRERAASRIVCSDPLASEYVKFRGRWLAKAVSKGSVEVDAHSIEDSPFPPGSFDVVVLINVLDHVMDVDRCLRNTLELLRPGGYFIFGQDLADPTSIGKYEWFEEGHPFRLTVADVEPHLTGLAPVLRKVVPPRDTRLQTGVLVFAGRR
jgi:SAM-dependent methyltransferase